MSGSLNHESKSRSKKSARKRRQGKRSKDVELETVQTISVVEPSSVGSRVQDGRNDANRRYGWDYGDKKKRSVKKKQFRRVIKDSDVV